MRLGARLRILSANLMNGGADPEAFADLVRALAVDVAALQELAPEQAEPLMDVLPHGLYEPARDHHGMGIGLRHPAASRRVELHYRDARAVDLDPADWPQLDTPLEILNVHIMAPHLGLPWQTLLGRARQLRGLLEYLRATPGRSQLLVGDLNATPIWRVYRRIARHRLDAARTLAPSRGRPPATWGPWPGAPRLLRIDHAFVQELQVQTLQAVPIRGSDHSALLLEI